MLNRFAGSPARVRPPRSTGVALLLFGVAASACAGNPRPPLLKVADLQQHAPAESPDGPSAAVAGAEPPADSGSTGQSRLIRAAEHNGFAGGEAAARAASAAVPAVPDPLRRPAFVADSAPREPASDLASGPIPEHRAVPAPMPAPAVAAEPVGGPAPMPEILQGNWIRVDRAYPPLDFTLFGRPIADVASLIAERSGQNIVLSDEPQVRDKQITGEIRGQPWHIALEALLEAHGLRAIQDQRTGIITVVTAERAGHDRRPFPIRLRYLYAKDILPSVKRILAASDSSANAVEIYGDEESSRTLIAYASPDRLAQVEMLVDSLDRRPRRVSVEVRMAQVNRTTMENLGFSYSFVPTGGDGAESNTGVQVQQNGTFRSISSQNGPAVQLLRELAGVGTIGLNSFIDAVSEVGIAETETTPLITANSGVTSEIMVGDAFILPNNQPILFGGGAYGGGMPGGPGQSPQPGLGGYPGGQMGGGMQGTTAAGGFARFETGTSLKVTPHVMGDNEISMTIELVRDGGNLSPDGRTITGGKQSAQTEVTVRNDTPIVIGGLTVNGRTQTDSGIPGLSRLPLIGRLFRREEFSTQYQDLIILVTPHIHEDGETSTAGRASGPLQESVP